MSQKEYDINHIVLQNGVYIKKFSDEIVNGKVFQMGGDMKVPLGKMKDGKKEGKWMVWYDNGTFISPNIWNTLPFTISSLNFLIYTPSRSKRCSMLYSF